MARPEDFGANSGAAEQDQVSKGAHAQFHDLVYRQPNGGGAKDEPFICHAWDMSPGRNGGFGGGRYGLGAEEALGQLYVDLAREGKLDKGTLRALDKIGDQLDDERHFGGGGGWKHHRGGHGKIELVGDKRPYGPGSQAEQDIPLDQNGNPIAYTAMDTSALNGATNGMNAVTADAGSGGGVADSGTGTGATVGDGGATSGQPYDATMQRLDSAGNTGLGLGSSDGSAVGATTNGGAVPGDGTMSSTPAAGAGDVQQMAALWAASHGANPADAAAFQQITQGADGKTSAVGPYALDANVIGGWFSQAVGQNGQIDGNALQQLATSKGLSPETAQAISSPEFQQFMSQWAQGQAPSADQVAKFLPQDLQNAIAGDMVTGMASALQQGGQQLDPGVLLASLEMRKPLTQQDLQDQTLAGYVQQIDASLANGAAGVGGTGDASVSNGTTTGGTGMDTAGVTVTGGDATTSGTGTSSSQPFTLTTGDGSAATNTSGATTGGDSGPITIAQDPNAQGGGAAPQPGG